MLVRDGLKLCFRSTEIPIVLSFSIVGFSLSFASLSVLSLSIYLSICYNYKVFMFFLRPLQESVLEVLKMGLWFSK